MINLLDWVDGFNVATIVVAAIFAWFSNRAELQPKRFVKVISKLLTAIIGLSGLIAIGTSSSYLVSAMNKVTQNRNKCILMLFIIAILPGMIAAIERLRDKSVATIQYVLQNEGYNLLGFVAEGFAFYITTSIVKDFGFLADLPLFGIVAMLFVLSVWIVLSYQGIEQEKVTEDHDTSLKNVNQCFNMLHLLCAYFVSLSSAAFLFSYSLYCYTHGIILELTWEYLLQFSLILAFFLTCSLNQQRHVYQVYLINTPVLLIIGVVWMSWFSRSQKMIIAQLITVCIFSLLYAIMVMRDEGMIKAYKRDKENDHGQGTNGEAAVADKKHMHELKLGRWRIGFQYLFSVMSLLVIILMFVIVTYVSATIRRLPRQEVEKYVYIFSGESGGDFKSGMAKMTNQEWYDPVNDDFDQGQVLLFFTEEYGQVLVKLGIVQDGRRLTCEKLDSFYKNYDMNYSDQGRRCRNVA